MWQWNISSCSQSSSTACYSLSFPPQLLAGGLKCHRCWATAGNPAEQLVMHERSQIEIKRKDMACMAPMQWLNDEIMNIYMALLLERDMRARSKVPPPAAPCAGHGLLCSGWLLRSLLDLACCAVFGLHCLVSTDALAWAGSVYNAATNRATTEVWLALLRVLPAGRCRACSPSATFSARSSSTSCTRTPGTSTRM